MPEEILDGEPGYADCLDQGQLGIVHRVPLRVLHNKQSTTQTDLKEESQNLVLDLGHCVEGHPDRGDNDKENRNQRNHLSVIA